MIETLGGDISAYIPTNVISITDGQIFLETDLFNEGQRPAINVSLSVSRVGGAAQTKLLKQVSGNLRAKLAQYRELAEFTQFGADVDEETRKALRSGKLLTEALKQPRYNPIPDHLQALLLFAVTEGYANKVEEDGMHQFETELYEYFNTKETEITAKLATGNKMDKSTKAELIAALDRFAERK
jgi:F-type H+-transporting ATPase subunit alpha